MEGGTRVRKGGGRKHLLVCALKGAYKCHRMEIGGRRGTLRGSVRDGMRTQGKNGGGGGGWGGGGGGGGGGVGLFGWG